MPPLISGKIEELSGLYDAFNRVKDIEISCGVLRIAAKDFIGLIGISSSSQIVGAVTKDAVAGKLTSNDAVDCMLSMKTGTFEYYEVPQKELSRLDQKLAVDISEVLDKCSQRRESEVTGSESEIEPDTPPSVAETPEHAEAEVLAAAEAAEHLEPDVPVAAEAPQHLEADVPIEAETSEHVEANLPVESAASDHVETDVPVVSVSAEPAEEIAAEAPSAVPTESVRAADFSAIESTDAIESASAESTKSDTTKITPFDINELNAIGSSDSRKPSFDVSALDAIGTKSGKTSGEPPASTQENSLATKKPTESLLAKFKQKAAETAPPVEAPTPEPTAVAAPFDPTADPLQKSAAETVERLKQYRRPESELEAEAERAQRLKFASGRRSVEEPDSADADKQSRIRPADKQAKELKAKTAPKQVSPKLVAAVGGVVVLAGVIFATRGVAANFFVSNAEKAYEKQDYKGALATLSPAFMLDSGNAKAHYLKGEILLAQDQNEEALEELNQALAASPLDMDIVRAHAQLALKMKKNRMLKEDADKLLTNDATAKSDGYWYGVRAKAELGLGQYDATIDDCTTALKLGQRTPWVYSRRGWAYTLKGKPKVGLKDFATALGMPNKDAAETYVGKAQALQNLGDTDGALAAFAQAFKQNSTTADYYVRRGQLYITLNKPDKAFQDFDQAIHVEPSYMPARIARADLLANQNKLDQAIQDLNSVPKKFETADLIFARARLYQRKGENKTAIGLFKQGLALNNKIIFNYVDLAICYAAVHDYKNALATIQTAIDAQPTNSSFHAYHGLYLEAQGNTVSALADYEKAIALDPKNSDAHFWRGCQFQNKGDNSAAIQDFQAAVSTNPGNLEAKKRLAALTKVERHSSSTPTQTSVVDSVKIIAGDFKSLMTQGYAKLKAHQARAAINYFASAIQQDSSSVEARRYLAYALAANNNKVDAVTQLQALQSMGGYTVSDDRMLGTLLLDLQRYGEAETVYLKLVTDNVKDTDSRVKLARAYKYSGQMEKAAKCLTEGKKNNPEATVTYDTELKNLSKVDSEHKSIYKPESAADNQG